MSKSIDWKALSAPFAATDIEWRIQQSGVKNGKPWGMVLAYVQNRAIQQRLDDVVSPEGWRNEYQKAPDGGVMCGLSIKIGSEWVTKWDGAENTDFEAVKGGLSNSMKRAAVQWGIGRYLYKLDAMFAEFSETKSEGAHYIDLRDKEDKKKSLYRGYWTDPKLPNWALPEEDARQTTPSAKNEWKPSADKQATSAQREQVANLLRQKGIAKEDMVNYLASEFGFIGMMTEEEAVHVIEHCKAEYKELQPA